MSNAKVKTGSVKFFLIDKGYGFITDEDNGDEFFFHITKIESGKIQKNDRVSFIAEQGKKGLTAVSVKLI